MKTLLARRLDTAILWHVKPFSCLFLCRRFIAETMHLPCQHSGHYGHSRNDEKQKMTSTAVKRVSYDIAQILIKRKMKWIYLYSDGSVLAKFSKRSRIIAKCHASVDLDRSLSGVDSQSSFTCITPFIALDGVPLLRWTTLPPSTTTATLSAHRLQGAHALLPQPLNCMPVL